MSEASYLVCAPATAGSTVRGSIFSHRCSKCCRRVMTAPSGQRYLRDNPGTRIVCYRCYRSHLEVAGGVHSLAAAPAEIVREMREAMPNPWLKRN